MKIRLENCMMKAISDEQEAKEALEKEKFVKINGGENLNIE